jgi:hypothetical protein
MKADAQIERSLLWLCGFTLGYSVNELQCRDLCFELGSKWLLRGVTEHTTNYPGYFDGMLPLRGPTPTCTPDEVAMLRTGWLKRSSWELLVRSGLASYLLWFPLFQLGRQPISFWTFWVGLLATGVFLGPIARSVYKCYRRLTFLHLGLTATETTRMAVYLESHSHEEPGYGSDHYLHTYGFRAWLRERDRVFISYSWHEPSSVATATRLFADLSESGVMAFQDVQAVSSQFASWRRDVVVPLINCTHMFVVVGPSTVRSHTHLLEILTALQSRNVELTPSIVCVVETKLAFTLLQDETAPAAVRFLLGHCPRLTPAECGDHQVLTHILRQRRRQTLFESWRAVLRPRSTLAHLLNAEAESSYPLING